MCAIVVFGELNLANPRMIRELLAHGGRSVIQAFLQAPRELATAMQTMASAHGFEELSMIALLTYGNTLAVQALVETPDKITAAIAVFSEMDLADSSIISKKLFGLLVHGRTLIVQILLESMEKLSDSIRVFSQNSITDPGMILMIMERAGDPVIQILMQDPQKLAEIILSAVGTQGIQACSSVFIMNEIQVTTLDPQTRPPTHTHRPLHTHTQIFTSFLFLKLLNPDGIITFSLHARNIRFSRRQP